MIHPTQEVAMPAMGDAMQCNAGMEISVSGAARSNDRMKKASLN